MHRAIDECKLELARLRETLRPGDEYIHYSHPDRRYRIVAIGLLEASQEPCVIYQALSDPELVWVRTVANFVEEVETPQGKVPRFSRAD